MEAAALPKCKGCGKDVAIHAQSGQPRKWCSHACGSACRKKHNTKKYIRRCVDCGKVWRTSHSETKRCRPCSGRETARKAALIVADGPCKACGGALAPGKIKFCSPACNRKHNTKMYIRRCVDCGKVWRTSHSETKRCRKCAGKEGNRKAAMIVVKRLCVMCGTMYVNSKAQCQQRFCRACRMKKKRILWRTSRSKRRARNRNNGPHETVIHHAVFDRHGWVCGICLEPVLRDADALNPLSAQLDHIIPLCRGGTNVYGNSQCSHRLCNQKKYSKDFAVIKQWVMTKKRATGQTVSGSLMVGW